MPPLIDGVTLRGGAKAVAAAYFRGANLIASDVLRPSVLALGGYGVSTGTGFYTGYTNYNFRMRAEAGADAVKKSCAALQQLHHFR